MILQNETQSTAQLNKLAFLQQQDSFSFMLLKIRNHVNKVKASYLLSQVGLEGEK